MFINLDPAFGRTTTKEQIDTYKQFNNYVHGKFVNVVSTSVFANSSDSSPAIKDSNTSAKDRSPANQIPVEPIDWNKIKSGKDSLTWLGHSAFLIIIDNKKMLIDPMLSPIASPVSFAGIKRYKYSEDMMNIINEMPPIDAVFISHDHYDHLDYQSIIKLKSKVSHFKEIGKKYGLFDITLIEGAQYDRRWAGVHMIPEQSVQASLDVNGKNMMLIHWGAFTLANHSWKEPIERALREAKKDGVNLIDPKIGETVILDSDFHSTASSRWDF